MHAKVGLVEVPARVLAPRDVTPGPEPKPVTEGALVLPARPEGKPHPRGGELLLVATEREGNPPDVDVDEALVRRRADVAVRGKRRPEVDPPPLAGPDLAKEALHVGDDGRGEVPGENLLEVPAGEGVPAPEEEGPGELQAHPYQLRPVDEQGAEGADGFVEQRLSFVLGYPRLPGRTGRRKADEEEHVRVDGAGRRQRAQDGQRLAEPAALEQGPGVGQAGGGRRRGRNRRTSGGSGEQNKGREHEDGEERRAVHRRP